jgi:hypothetical protein
LHLLRLLFQLVVHDHRQDHGGQPSESHGTDQSSAGAFFELQIGIGGI